MSTLNRPSVSRAEIAPPPRFRFPFPVSRLHPPPQLSLRPALPGLHPLHLLQLFPPLWNLPLRCPGWRGESGVAEGGKTEEGPNLAVTALPPPRPESPNQGGKGRRSRETARVRGGVGGSQPAPPGASETRLCGHQGAPGLLRLVAWPGYQPCTKFPWPT